MRVPVQRCLVVFGQQGTAEILQAVANGLVDLVVGQPDLQRIQPPLRIIELALEVLQGCGFRHQDVARDRFPRPGLTGLLLDVQAVSTERKPFIICSYSAGGGGTLMRGDGKTDKTADRFG